MSAATLSPRIAGVGSELPLVDQGLLNPTCATGGTREWGSTIGQAAFIDRSGFGVTATGTEIYVAGPSLSVCTLGRGHHAPGRVTGPFRRGTPGGSSGHRILLDPIDGVR